MPPERMLHLIQGEFKKLFDNFRTFFFGKTGISDSIAYSIPLICEIYRRIDQRRDYYSYFHTKSEEMNMSQAKEVVLLAYWMLKYKPLSMASLNADELFERKNCTINEYFAVFCIFALAKRCSPRKDIDDYFSPRNLDNLVYTFMHRDISKEAMICYVESLLNVA
jgi:hypothetical protein